MEPAESNRIEFFIDEIIGYEGQIKQKKAPDAVETPRCPDCAGPQPEEAEPERPEEKVGQVRSPDAVETLQCSNCTEPQPEEEKPEEEVKQEEAPDAVETPPGAKSKAAREQGLLFLGVPPETMEYAKNSLIPDKVMAYYKQFGLNELNVRLLFHARPSETLPLSPSLGQPVKAVPRRAGCCKPGY